MKSSPAPSSSNVTAAAALGARHGYQFDGDQVALTASFRVLARTAHQRTWALQLLAGEGREHVVASAPLPPLAELADENETFTVQAAAFPPAGTGEHVLGLALVTTDAQGRAVETHDYVAFPRRESFCLPRLGAPVAARVNGHQVEFSVGAITNPRAASNLTGTLSLELWSLPSAYAGGAFAGQPIGGVILGRLAGASAWTDLRFTVPAAAPAAGHLVVMLREWTAAGYITRDFASVAAPAAVATPATPAAAAPASAAKAGVNVNRASVAELTAIKGISRPVAQGIVAGRPFRRWDDLLSVKGMGPKVFSKVRGLLRLD